MPENKKSTPITIQRVLLTLGEMYPGVPIQQGTSLNGEVASVDIWEFRIHVSLTTRKVSPTNVRGRALLTFWQRTEGRKPIERDRLITENWEEAQEFLKYIESWIYGVMAALDFAFQKPPEERVLAAGLEALLRD